MIDTGMKMGQSYFLPDVLLDLFYEYENVTMSINIYYMK